VAESRHPAIARLQAAAQLRVRVPLRRRSGRLSGRGSNLCVSVRSHGRTSFRPRFAECFTPHPAKRPWYRILNSNSNSNSNDPQGSSPLLAIQAHGNLHVDRFGLKKVSATQLTTQWK